MPIAAEPISCCRPRTPAADVIGDAVRATEDTFVRELGPERFADLVEILAQLTQGQTRVEAADSRRGRHDSGPGQRAGDTFGPPRPCPSPEVSSW